MHSRRAEIFVKVAECGSFAKAAGELYLSSVSVMKQVESLEAKVGCALFDRSNRGVTLTEAGRSLYGDASRVVQMSRDAVGRVSATYGPGERVIRVGTSFLRPCSRVVELWMRKGDPESGLRIEIVPFSDDRRDLARMATRLGDGVDLFCGPCGSQTWREDASVFPLGTCDVQVGVPQASPLAGKERLEWGDLEGRDIILPTAGESEVLDALRAEISSGHAGVGVVDWHGLYDARAFNECAARGCLMETLDVWAGVHPSIATLPVEWDYRMPFGIVCAKEPKRAVSEFVEIVTGD